MSHKNRVSYNTIDNMNKLTFIVAFVGFISNSSLCVVAQGAKNSNRDLPSSSSFSTNKISKVQRSTQQESDSSTNITPTSDNNETSTDEIETEEEHDDQDQHTDEDLHLSANDGCHCDGDVVHCWGGDADESAYYCHDGVIEGASASDAHAHSSDCHCDGNVPHCSDAADEASYDCSSTSQSSYEPDCHCDADVVHCTGGIGNDICSCTTNGVLQCEGFKTIVVGDDIRNVALYGKPWREIIITSLIVNLSTLAGVFVVAGAWFMKRFFPNCKASEATGILWMEVLIPMFACGALLATTFFILLPESFNIIMAEFTGIDLHEGHDHRRFLEGDEEDDLPGESAGTWRWGASIMGGFWIPVLMHSCFPHDSSGAGGHSHDNHVHDDTNDGEETNQDLTLTPIKHVDNITKTLEKRESDGGVTGIEDSQEIIRQEEAVVKAVVTNGDNDGSTNNSNSDATTNDDDNDNGKYVVCCCGLIRLKNLPLFVSMNVGEALHNFTDGIFIGTAWLLCGNSMAISIAIATILHELPNQLAGYLVMVNQCGMNPIVALILNFLFGLSILFGGLIVLVFDFKQVTVGCILAIGGGTFIHVAIGELLQNAERNMTTSGIQMIYCFIAFLAGAVPIGLILINHEHC